MVSTASAGPSRALRVPSGSGASQLGIFALAYLVYFGVRAVTEGSAAEAAGNAPGITAANGLLGLGAAMVAFRTLRPWAAVASIRRLARA